MSRSRSRGRHRRQRMEAALREAIERARSADARGADSPSEKPDNGQLWELLVAIERSGLQVWDVARAIRCSEDELAMIAQVVAPHLVRTAPGTVTLRDRYAK